MNSNYPPVNNSSLPDEVKLSGSLFLPSPEILQKYNSVLPGLADRLVAQAEQQTSHRIFMEKRMLNSNILKSLLGLLFGFFIGVLGVGGGLYLTYAGFNVIGIIFSSATLVSLVMSFVYGSQSKRDNSQVTGEMHDFDVH
jgi:uncharacterized membrane protein